MINDTQEVCSWQAETVRHIVYQIIWLIYVLFSLAALIIMIPIIRVVFKIFQSPITITLSRLLLLFSAVFLIMFIATSIFHLINHLTANNACDYIFYVYNCVWSFPLITLCLIGIATSQAGLSVARLLSTINVGAKLDESKRIGVGLGVLVIIVSLISLVLGLIESDPLENRVICALIPTSAARTSNYLFYFLLLLDFITLFLYLLSWYRNRQLTKETWYSLALKFKIEENYRGIKLFLPMVIMHFVMFGFYTISTIILRSFRDGLILTTYNEIGLALFIIPIYLLIQNILLYCIIREEINKRKKFQKSMQQSNQQQSEAYFKGLHNQWNNKK